MLGIIPGIIMPGIIGIMPGIIIPGIIPGIMPGIMGRIPIGAVGIIPGIPVGIPDNMCTAGMISRNTFTPKLLIEKYVEKKH